MYTTFKAITDYTGIDLVSLISTTEKTALIAYRKGVLPSQIDPEFESKALIKRAQSIIEIYTGKDEIDVENPSDLLILNKMTAYQTVYMIENEESVYNQVAVKSQGQTDFIIDFDKDMSSPWIAPLAVIASKGLSWKRSRRYRTGKMFQKQRGIDWRTI